MQPGHFAELCEGVQERINRNEKTFRKLAFLSVLPHSEKGFSFEVFCRDFWPLPGGVERKLYDNKIEKSDWDAIVKANNLQIQKNRRENGGIRRTEPENNGKR